MKKLGDWAIALTVVICSVVLFLALAFALQGNPFDHPRRTLRADFPDITGVQTSSLVKYAGAVAGSVDSIRILTPEERIASGHPENAVEVVLAIDNKVPPLSRGLVASIASDTLLSDKFIVLLGGNPKAPVLENGAVIASITPVTFDAILRDIGGMLESVRRTLGGSTGGLDGLLPLANKTLAELGRVITGIQTLLAGGDTLLTDASSLLKSGNGLLADGRTLLAENRPALARLLAQLSQTADSLDALTKRADELVETNGPNIDASTREAAALLRELKQTAASTRTLVDQLRARPQSLLWGPGRPPRPPTGAN